MTAWEGIDADTAYRALSARDPRFDGRVWFGVTSTGIYCRPICPARTPRRDHVAVFPSAAAAVASGFRACRRCRPDAAPGTRDWDVRQDLAARAVRLIAAGAVDHDGVAGLAERLHVSSRHLHRVLVAEVGVGPLPLAVSRRAQTARLLLDQTDLAVADVAFAAGFTSIRQFNDVIRREFGAPPTRLRATRRTATGARPGATGRPRPGPDPGADVATLVLRLRWRPPYDAASVLTSGVALAPASIDLDRGRIERAVRLPSGTARIAVTLSPDAGHAVMEVTGVALGDLAGLVSGVRRWLDLDADPDAVAAVLSADPVLAPLVAARPGVRVPTGLDPWEAVVATVAAQHVSTASARAVLARLAGDGLLPAVEDVAAAGPQALRRAGLPLARARALHAVAEAVATGHVSLGPDADPDRLRSDLRAIPGIGPWTAELVVMRALADPDAFPDTDLALRRAASAAGMAAGDLARRSARWRPWRSYAAAHLWLAARRGGIAAPTGTPPTPTGTPPAPTRNPRTPTGSPPTRTPPKEPAA